MMKNCFENMKVQQVAVNNETREAELHRSLADLVVRFAYFIALSRGFSGSFAEFSGQAKQALDEVAQMNIRDLNTYITPHHMTGSEH